MQDAPASSLPLDLAACHAILAEQTSVIRDLQTSRETLSQEVAELNLTVQKRLAQLRGHRSERHEDPPQQQLDFGQDEAVQDGLADAAVEQEADAERKQRKFLSAAGRSSPRSGTRNCPLTWSVMKSSPKSRSPSSSAPSMAHGT